MELSYDQGSLAINLDDKPTEEACTDMLRSGVRQMRYRLKNKYFNGVPANVIRTTSLVACMTDEQWKALVAKWSDPKNMVCGIKQNRRKVSSHFKPMISSDMFIILQESSEKNKQNHRKVKYHQATGSRSYVAHLHAYVSKEYHVHICTK